MNRQPVILTRRIPGNQRHNVRLDLLNFSDLTNTQDISIRIIKTDGSQLQIPSETKFSLKFSEYLRSIHGKIEEFDCLSFAYHMIDKPYRLGSFPVKFEGSNLLVEGWDCKNISEKEVSKLKLGDLVIIYNPDIPNSLHALIYLEEGMFLSKLGTDNLLVASDLQEIKNFYKANTAVLLTEKLPQNKFRQILKILLNRSD